MLLHFGIYSLCSDNCRSLAGAAQYCLDQFVLNFEKLFVQDNQTYNNHVLRHLPESVLKFGALDTFSSFPFENHLSLLKKRTKATNCIFQQTVNNLLEIRSIYSTLKYPAVKLSSSSPNNCVLLKSKEVIFIELIEMNSNYVKYLQLVYMTFKINSVMSIN